VHIWILIYCCTKRDGGYNFDNKGNVLLKILLQHLFCIEWYISLWNTCLCVSHLMKIVSDCFYTNYIWQCLNRLAYDILPLNKLCPLRGRGWTLPILLLYISFSVDLKDSRYRKLAKLGETSISQKEYQQRLKKR